MKVGKLYSELLYTLSLFDGFPVNKYKPYQKCNVIRSMVGKFETIYNDRISCRISKESSKGIEVEFAKGPHVRHVGFILDDIDNITKAVMCGFDHICKEFSLCPIPYICKEDRNVQETTLIPEITNVIFEEPATIVFWADGTKTVVRIQEDEEFDPEKGLAMAISKKVLGNKREYYHTFLHWKKKYEKSSKYLKISESSLTGLSDGHVVIKVNTKESED